VARKTRTIGDFAQLWQRHEALYQTIFCDALAQLSITDEQRKDEDAISEALCPILRQVCFNHTDKPKTPEWERPISPVNGEELKGGKVRKRPDFTCTLVNTFADSAEMHEMSLHIECKRLGKKKGSWALNKNYIENGVKRFDCSTHEYGKRAPCGMMIGYIVNSDTNSVLNDINGHLPTTISALQFLFATTVECCDSTFNRHHVDPKHFKLIHLWADLRSTDQ
jgi:hypothetical protein